MRPLVFIAAVGCAASNAPQATETMPLPGETSSRAAFDEPNFRVDPAEHPGRLSEDEIESVIQHAQPDLIGCYEQVLAVSPDVQGTANTIFVIGTNGAVIAAASAGVEPRLARCIDSVVARRMFPAPRGGTVKIRYPFTFTRERGDTSNTSTATAPELQSGTPPSGARVTCGRRR